jgi:hypothetical protein
MNLIYISEGNGSAIRSQVFEYIKYVSELRDIEKVYFLISTKIKDDHPKFNENVIVINFYNYGIYPFLEILNSKELKKSLKKIDFDKEDIFHIRSSYLAFLFLTFFEKNYKYEPKLVIDIRGVVLEENSIKEMSFLKKQLKRQLILRVIKHLNKRELNYSVVSKDLKEYVKKRFNCKNIYINPCFASENFKFDMNRRNEIREYLGVGRDEILVVFSSGSRNNWQNQDKVINHFAKSNKLLLLTKEKYSGNLNNVISKFVDYSKVPEYLCAADIGVILRDKSIVNEVASPIKFSEYVACGLPVITDGNVNQINRFIIENNFGVIVKLDNFNQNFFDKILIKNREIFSMLGVKHYGIKKIIEGYMNTYNKL